MAEKRMFSAKIIESDAFLDIPATAQKFCLPHDFQNFLRIVISFWHFMYHLQVP
jgi:hypothetical protein